MNDEQHTTPALDAVSEVEAAVAPDPVGHDLSETSDLTQVLTQAAAPAPEPPKPTRYVTVWAHVLNEFEKFDNAVASMQPNGALLIHRFGDDPRWTPPIKGYAPGGWVTFEHVGDFTPPKRPVPAPVRPTGGIQTDPDFRRRIDNNIPDSLAENSVSTVPSRTSLTDEERAEYQRKQDLERSQMHADRAARAADDERRSVRPGADRPRTYGPPQHPSEKVGPEARRRAFAVLNGEGEGGGVDDPKASTDAEAAPTEPPADPEFWGDGEGEDRSARTSFLRRAWHAAKTWPMVDPMDPEA